jgi:hypothetical protein
MENKAPLAEKKIADSEILRGVLNALDIPADKFRKKLEYKSAATMGLILKGQNNLSDDMIDKIIKNYPQVSYWYLKKGRLPIILEEKLSQNQMSILFSKDQPSNAVNYDFESLETLKNIEAVLLRIENLLLNKKSDQ